MGPHVWGFDEETPEQVVGHLLAAQQKTLAVMETCSGGQLASSITDVPGASAYFKGSITPYSKEAKIAAGVDAATIERYGEASEETASAMAQAVRTSLQADYGVAITGVAGPGEMEGLPVGVVFVALDDGQEVQVQRQRLPTRRVTIKRRAAAAALIELARVLKGGALNPGRDD
jgi:nicotinamide-nucleotide amidase